MYYSTLVEQFIKDIKVIDLGQTVIIDCCPLVAFNNNKIYKFKCLKCEEIKLSFDKNMIDYIEEDSSIDLLEFSVKRQENNKIRIYIYGRVVLLDVLCE